jgi:hypothetical protein
MKDSYSKSIGREAAIALSDSKWWEGLPKREIARRQLFTRELTCPFNIFHEAIEDALCRPVFTHEFGLNYDGICQEFLGEADAPTFEEIVNLIPAEKRVLVASPS